MKSWCVFFVLLSFSMDAVSQSAKAYLISAGLDIVGPVGGYREVNQSVFVGGKISLLTNTRMNDLFVGGSVGYGVMDMRSETYPGINPFGIETTYEETLYNTHLYFAADFRYKPFVSQKIQPYVSGSAGIRRVGTFLVTTDILDNVQAGSQVYEKDWVFQVEGAIGALIPLNNGFFLDISFRYLETQAARHLVRKKVDPPSGGFFATDYFDLRNTGLQLIGGNLSIVYAF